MPKNMKKQPDRADFEGFSDCGSMICGAIRRHQGAKNFLAPASSYHKYTLQAEGKYFIIMYMKGLNSGLQG